jgi:N-acetylmuramoyl-L-alanine amidase
MNKMIPILDNGHAGMIGGKYETPGKRSPNWEKGILYEGMFNRWFVNRLIEKMDREGLKYYHASPELTDVPLSERVERSNRIHKSNKDTFLLSIHANAGGGKGIEGFTSVGETKSDAIGEMILKQIEKDFKNVSVMRFDLSDGDRDKESNFYVLRNTNCHAFLLECGFMDEISDYNKLWNVNYLKNLVDSVFKVVKKLQNKD